MKFYKILIQKIVYGAKLDTVHICGYLLFCFLLTLLLKIP